MQVNNLVASGIELRQALIKMFSIKFTVSAMATAALLTVYFTILVLMAKFSNPEFMKQSIGVVDSIVRAHIYAMFKVTTFNLNPIYMTAAAYPFWIFYLYFSYWWIKYPLIELGGRSRPDGFVSHLFSVFIGVLVLSAIVLILRPIAPKYIDFHSPSQLMNTEEGKFYTDATIKTVSDMAHSLSGKLEKTE